MNKKASTTQFTNKYLKLNYCIENILFKSIDQLN